VNLRDIEPAVTDHVLELGAKRNLALVLANGAVVAVIASNLSEKDLGIASNEGLLV
jgi:hypothetical protein